MSEYDYSADAAAWVNLLVPGHFDEAAKLISDACTYNYKDQILRGSSVIEAFVESHAKATKELDSIEYLPGVPKEFLADGALISVADKIRLNGKTHIYRDQLRVRMQSNGSKWRVVELQHLPIAEERTQLQEFLKAAGPKRT
jgi:hypothetical protein